jgi:hypothetical protein
MANPVHIKVRSFKTKVRVLKAMNLYQVYHHFYKNNIRRKHIRNHHFSNKARVAQAFIYRTSGIYLRSYFCQLGLSITWLLRGLKLLCLKGGKKSPALGQISSVL